jgi:hypothetical protein
MNISLALGANSHWERDREAEKKSEDNRHSLKDIIFC